MEIATYPEKFPDEITIGISTDYDGHCVILLSNQVGRILRMMGVNVIKNMNSNFLYSSILTKF
jgi:hypothetical protein